MKYLLQLLSTLCFETRSLRESARSRLFSFPQCRDSRHTLFLSFYRVLGSELRSSCLCCKPFTNGAISPGCVNWALLISHSLPTL